MAVFLLWREIFTTTGKKSSSRLSGRCVSFWFWREIGSFFVVARNFHYDRRKKKFQSSVWRVCQFLILAGNWQFFCCGRKFSLRPEKKSSSSLPEKKDTVVCLAGARSITTGKKRYSRLSDGCAVLAITTKKKDTVFVLLMKGLSSTN